jgi:nitrite reductase (NADH) small subunit
VHALGDLDPLSGAAVQSRGIVGDRGGVRSVELDVRVPTNPARIAGEAVQVGLPYEAS